MRRRGCVAALLAVCPLLVSVAAAQALAVGSPQMQRTVHSTAAVSLGGTGCATTEAGWSDCPGGAVGPPSKLNPSAAVSASEGGGGPGRGVGTSPADSGTPSAPAYCPALASCQTPALMRVCDEPANAGVPCAGPPANCPGPPDQTRYVYWIASPQGWAAVQPRKEFCSLDPVNQTAWVNQVLLEVSPQSVTATVNPFAGALPVTLPVYLWVKSVPLDVSDTRTNGNLTISTRLTNPHFVWSSR